MARQSTVTCQLSASMVMPTTTTAIELATVLDSVEVNARWAPMTSLLSRETSAPVWVRVKNASDWRWTWPKTLRAEVVDQPLPDPAGEPAAEDAEQRAEDGHHGHGEGQLDDQATIALQDAVVDDALHQQRDDHDHGGVDDRDDQEDGDQALVRAGEPEDPADRTAVDPVVDHAAVGAQVTPGGCRPGTVHPDIWLLLTRLHELVRARGTGVPAPPARAAAGSRGPARPPSAAAAWSR